MPPDDPGTGSSTDHTNGSKVIIDGPPMPKPEEEYESGDSSEEDYEMATTPEREKELRRIARSLEHAMTHLPKNLYCKWCQRAKLYKKPARRIKGRRGEIKPDHFGICVTCDHMVTKDVNSQGIDAEKYCLTFYDDATRFTMAYPVGHRNAADSLEALRDFEGPTDVIKSIYIDGAPEFVKMCR